MLPLGTKPIFCEKKRRVRARSDVLGVQVFTTYDCIRSDFTPSPSFPFAHLLERILLSKAENVAGKWLRQSAHGFFERGFEYSAGHMNTIPLCDL